MVLLQMVVDVPHPSVPYKCYNITGQPLLGLVEGAKYEDRFTA